jgi:hypothetical protein
MFEAQASICALTQLLSCNGQGYIRHERRYLQLKEGIAPLLSVKRCTDTSLRRIPAGHTIVPWRETGNHRHNSSGQEAINGVVWESWGRLISRREPLF